MRSKYALEEPELSRPETQNVPTCSPPRPRIIGPWRTSLSLLLSPEITAVREELSKVVVVTLLSGYVSDKALEEVLPSIINCSLAGSLTPVNDITYLIPLSNRA